MRHIIISITLIVSAFQLSGQVNSDSIFDSAISYAQAGSYDTALSEAAIVLDLFPERYDIMVFCANVNAWKGDYAAALAFIDSAYLINEDSPELYDSWLNVLLWSGDYPKLLEIAELAAANNYPNDYNLVLKKALAHNGLTAYDDGVSLIEENEAYLDSAVIKALYDDMQMSKRTNAISFYYSIDLFDQDALKPQHLAYVDYTFKKKQHTFVPRLSFAHRFDKNDFQLELDYYHSFKNEHYLYANYGLGLRQELFPLHKAGLEYYVPLPLAFETSLGARYFYANKSNTFMLTGHLSKTIHKLWLSFRPFYVFNETKNSLTLIFSGRYYGVNPINYWGLQLAYGNSPDERYLITSTPEIFTLKNYRLKVDKNFAIYKYSEIKLSAAYAYEEYSAGNFRNRLRFELLLKHKF